MGIREAFKTENEVRGSEIGLQWVANNAIL